MTAWVVHRFAELVGLPGSAVIELAYLLQSRPFLQAGLALKLPSFWLHIFALELADN